MFNRLQELTANVDLTKYIVTISPTSYSEYILEIHNKSDNSLCYRKNTYEPNWARDVRHKMQNFSKPLITLTKEQAIDIRSVERSLKEALDYDEYNSGHYVKFLNQKSCNNFCSWMVCPCHAQSLYVSFVYSMYFYIEYTNNYLNISTIAEHYNLEVEIAQTIVDEGRATIDALVAWEK